MTRKQIVTRFHLFLVVVLLAVTAVAFYKVPADMGLPIHWGFDGKPDQVWPKNFALAIFPVAGLLLTALFALIGQLAPVQQIELGRDVAETALAGLLGLFALLEFALVLIGLNSDIDLVRIVAFGLAALLLILGLQLPRSQPNIHAGIRLPWTMRDPRNWTATHVATGWAMVLAAIALCSVAIVRPDPPDVIVAILLALFVPILIGIVVSLVGAVRR